MISLGKTPELQQCVSCIIPRPCLPQSVSCLMQDQCGSAGIEIRLVKVTEQDPRGGAPHQRTSFANTFAHQQRPAERLERIMLSSGHRQRGP